MAMNWSLPSNSSLPSEFYYFDFLSTTIFILTRLVLLVPVSIWVIYLAYQRWRQQRSFKSTSHCDVITYNMAVMQLFGITGAIFYLFGYLLPQLSSVGICISSVTVVGDILFHLLTCVERYLAVIFPLIYQKLKNTKGVQLRNICIVSVWLFTFGWSGQIILCYPDVPFIPFFCLSCFVFLTATFCSLSVLCVLIRPRAGEVGGDRVDMRRKKAFKTILAITAATWLLFIGYFLCIALRFAPSLSYRDWCLGMMSAIWFSLPSSLMVPLLFLMRQEKLICCLATSE